MVVRRLNRIRSPVRRSRWIRARMRFIRVFHLQLFMRTLSRRHSSSSNSSKYKISTRSRGGGIRRRSFTRRIRVFVFSFFLQQAPPARKAFYWTRFVPSERGLANVLPATTTHDWISKPYKSRYFFIKASLV